MAPHCTVLTNIYSHCIAVACGLCNDVLCMVHSQAMQCLLSVFHIASR